MATQTNVVNRQRKTWVFTAAPTNVNGRYEVGDTVFSLTPSDNLGWVCTVAGSPGTWLPISGSGGTATVANATTSIAVTHNFGATPNPDQIFVTPTNNMGTATKFYVDTLTATQFTINVDQDPGVTTATFSWRVFLG